MGDRNEDVVIVGGGIVGLSIAWRLAQRGQSVTLIERGRIGQEASGAAAGMLAPFAEAKTRGPFSDLGMESLSRYPKFVDELKSETGLDVELVRTGLLRVAEGEDEAELRETYGAMREMGSSAEWIGCSELRKLEPSLAHTVTAAIYSPTEWQLDPRRLVNAVGIAASNRGVRIIEREQVIGFSTKDGKVAEVQITSGTVTAGKVVVAGGAWNHSIASWLGANLPIKPIRGQIAALGPCYPQPLQHTIYSHHGYLVPRTDGRILVGSTEDDAGFDARPTAQGIAEILARAVELAPGLALAPVADTWAGLRPLAADRMPVLGRLNGWNNAFVAAGHFRNGILLTPITAYLMAELISTGVVEIDAAFSPDRFSQ